MGVQTIDEALAQMDTIVADCRRARSRLGFFAALYRQVTRAVRAGIAAGRFEDGARMERLDVCFANRYLDAYEQFRRGARPTRSWRLAFEQGSNPNLLVLHHLLLGMNAHINLDLGIAAARSCPGPDLPPLLRDFNEINRVLAELLDGVQQGLGQISSAMAMADQVVTVSDRVIANFSMKRARESAWQVATQLAPLPPARQALPIRLLDHKVRALGILICTSAPTLPGLHHSLLAAESPDIVRIIDALS